MFGSCTRISYRDTCNGLLFVFVLYTAQLHTRDLMHRESHTSTPHFVPSTGTKSFPLMRWHCHWMRCYIRPYTNSYKHHFYTHTNTDQFNRKFLFPIEARWITTPSCVALYTCTRYYSVLTFSHSKLGSSQASFWFLQPENTNPYSLSDCAKLLIVLILLAISSGRSNRVSSVYH